MSQDIILFPPNYLKMLKPFLTCDLTKQSVRPQDTHCHLNYHDSTHDSRHTHTQICDFNSHHLNNQKTQGTRHLENVCASVTNNLPRKGII